MNLKLIQDKKYRNHSEFVVDIMNLKRIHDKDRDIMIKKRMEVDSYSNRSLDQNDGSKSSKGNSLSLIDSGIIFVSNSLRMQNLKSHYTNIHYL